MRLLHISLALALAACAPTADPQTGSEAPAVTDAAAKAPTTRKGDTVDVIHGTEVADPYRWLEDLDAEEVANWTTEQNAWTRAHLDTYTERGTFAKRLAELWTYESWSNPIHRGDQFVYTYNDGTKDQPVYYVTSDLSERGRVLLDPNTLSADGTVAISTLKLSKDGKLAIYGIAESGSDWRTFRIRDVATGEDLPDTIKWAKFTDVSWMPDGSGFFYSRYPEPGPGMEDSLSFHKVYFHKVGTEQSADVLVYENPDEPEWGFDAQVSHDGKTLFVTVSQGTAELTRLYTLDLTAMDLAGGKAGAPVRKVFDAYDANYQVVHSEGDKLWIFTDKDAPMNRVVLVDASNPAQENWTEVIPESTDNLRGVEFTGGKLIATYLHDASSKIVTFNPDGTGATEVELPGIGSASGFEGGAQTERTWFSFSSFTTPEAVYAYDIATNEVTPVWQPEVAFDPADFTVSQEWYTSKDGTKVPMFLVHRKDVTPSGDVPTLLYGYGGFNIPLTPRFKVPYLAWVEAGGLYAMPNLRGGGEFGRDWHQAGTLQNKQNVFDDFIAAGEHLISSGWTSSEHLGTHGRSNGGLLAGATLVQRPDLFGAVVPGVGVLDMLRYQKFTIGWAWASDYGTADDSPEMFNYLLGYSPVHNAMPATYPATMVMTADHDDRVVPSHSYKFTAALQEAQQGDAPVLIRVETKAGHGAGTPISMLVEDRADMLGFFAHHLGLQMDESVASAEEH